MGTICIVFIRSNIVCECWCVIWHSKSSHHSQTICASCWISSISIIWHKQIIFHILMCDLSSSNLTKHIHNTIEICLHWNVVSFGKWSSSFFDCSTISSKIIISICRPVKIASCWIIDKTISAIIVSRSISRCIHTSCCSWNCSRIWESIIVSPLIKATIRTSWRNICWSCSFVLVANCNTILIILNNCNQSRCWIVIYSRQYHINCNWISRRINQIVVCI